MPFTQTFPPEFLKDVVAHFVTEGAINDVVRYGQGHINDTFYCGSHPGYILQRINTAIFPNPEGIISNILGVTNELKSSIEKQGGDPKRESLTLIPLKEGGYLYHDPQGGAWRMYRFIDHSLSLELPRSKEDFRESGYGFGRFASLLSSYPVASLFVSIPHFHDTPKRYRDFLTSVQQDAAHRASGVAEEIAFFEARQAKISELELALEKGALPSRVTHNDTKLNNVLLDEATGRALCVIDLDTIMPGSVLFDFGDSIRFGANTAVEDEKDLRKVSLSLPLFQAYAEGYLAGFGKALTSKEKENLPLGAYTMTMECGMRFLSDYLNGDTYFLVAYPIHNLVRAHTQIALAKDMEKKWDQMSILISQIH